MRWKPLSLFYSKKSETRSQGVSYTSCLDLPLYNFIQICVTDDLKWLVISGEPDNLKEVWASILAEFSDMSDSPQLDNVFKLKKKITFLTNKIDIVNILLNRLSLGGNKDIVKLLISWGYSFGSSDIEKDIERARKQLNNDTAKLRMAIADYAEATKGSNETSTLQDWEDELFQLSKFSGFAINKKQTTVSEYAALKKAFNAYVEYLKKKKRD
jgi:hypothetical protein